MRNQGTPLTGYLPAMPRIHAFELQDQPWYPATLGDAGTAYLRTLSRLLGAERFLTPPIAGALKEAGVDRIVDLCSGAGGPVTDIARTLREQGQPVAVVLSDLKPNTAALAALADAPGVTVAPQPVDAAAVPAGMTGLRTLFNAFHHFDDDLALAVLQDAVDAGQPIAIVELSERAPQTVIGAALIPLMVCLVMPMVRPVRRTGWC